MEFNMTYEENIADMLESKYNVLFSETTHNHPLTIRTACVVSYVTGTKIIQSATLVQDRGKKSTRMHLPVGFKLPWS